MPSSAIGSVLESMPGSVLENVLGYLGEYSECTWESLESLLGSISQSRLGVCHREQFGA